MIRRFFASLALIDVVMVAGIVGGLVWLAAIYVAAMNHGPALMLAVLAGLAAFARLRLWPVSHPADPDDKEVNRS